MSLFKAVYMFHAIGNLDAEDSADKHYAFAEDKFFDLLQKIGGTDSILSSCTANAHKSVCTFDDGHISNYRIAMLMREKNLGYADFFINPSTIGKKFYLSWDQVREMSAAGMSMQSHSFDHLYLSDLDEKEQRYQLQKSKATIEDKTGKTVSIIAPPGGRFNNLTRKIAAEVGYDIFAGSVPGMWNTDSSAFVKRIPVMQHNSVHKLESCIHKLSLHRSKLQAKYYMTYGVKRVMGNNSYDALRRYVLG